MQNRLWYFFLLIPFFYSCEKGIFNAGPPASKEIILTDTFNRIEIKNIFDIILIQDTINKAIIKCGENLISNVNINISDDVLWIDHSITYNWSREYEKIKINLHLKTIPAIYIRQAVSISTIDTFKTNDFIVIVWGSRFAEINACIDANFCGIYMSLDDFGKYIIKGKSNSTDIHPCGSGFVDCRDLVSENFSIWQRSIADAYINVTKELTVEYNGKGNIYYKGNPDTIINVNEPTQGKLIPYHP